MQLARRWRDTHDRAAFNRLILSQCGLVTRLARQWLNRHLSLDDLLQEAWYGLTEALYRFDPDRGFRVATYAVWWIEARLRLYRERRLAPLRHEIALEYVCQEGADGDQLVLGDLLPAPDDGTLIALQWNLLLEAGFRSWGRFLNRRELFVIQQYYLCHPSHTLAEIGRQLHVSRERVRQIREDALRKLRRFALTLGADNHEPERM